MQPEFYGVSSSLQVIGEDVWNNRGRRGKGRVEISYNIPFAQIREHYPDAKFEFYSDYIGFASFYTLMM